MNIGTKIINLRKEKNLTQEELAKKIHVSPKTISSYETNRNIPSIEILILLAKEFDISIDELISLNQNNANKIKETYEKKKVNEQIKSIVLLGILLLIPIVFFWYANYVNALMVYAYINAQPDIDAFKLVENLLLVFDHFVIEYIIYLFYMLINYILYKKEKLKSLVLINGIVIGLFLIKIIMNLINNEVFGNYDSLIFLISAIIGLIYFIILKKQKIRK